MPIIRKSKKIHELEEDISSLRRTIIVLDQYLLSYTQRTTKVPRQFTDEDIAEMKRNRRV